MSDASKILMGKLHDLYDEGRYRDVIAVSKSLSWTSSPEFSLKANFLVGSAQYQAKLYVDSHSSFKQLCHFDLHMNYRFYLARSYLPLKNYKDAELEFAFSLNEVQSSAAATCKVNQYQGYYIYIQALMDFGFLEQAAQKFLNLDHLYKSMSARQESELFHANIPSFHDFFSLGDRVLLGVDKAQERRLWKGWWQEQLNQDESVPQLLGSKSRRRMHG